jgi:Ser/Thr protein kinase RdoA (MazF antagonist)
MASLSTAISRQIGTSGGAAVEAAIFGSDRPDQIAAAITKFCEQALAASAQDALFYVSSVGCAVGVRLDDGREVVIKAFQPRWSEPFLAGVHEIQRCLHDRGFPCPRPIVGPLPLGNGSALVDAVLPDPGLHRVSPSLAGISAAGLARQIRECRDLDGSPLAGHPMNAPSSDLYPEPHSPVFDFVSTAPGAEWIDDLARRSKSALERDGGPAVIAHSDWSARNVRMSTDGVVAVYDWDSLALIPETVAVGQAAATWSATGEETDQSPTLVEMADFVRAYEHERGRVFDDRERRAIDAAIVWVLAYAARCEHAIDPTGGRRVRARPRLKADGERLLSGSSLY